MEHFDMESTVFEGWSLLYISIKSFVTFLSFSPIFAYISLSVTTTWHHFKWTHAYIFVYAAHKFRVKIYVNFLMHIVSK